MTDSEREELARRLFGWNGEEPNHEEIAAYGREIAEAEEERYLGLALELWLEGWTAEPVRNGLPIMSWAWRRPGKRGGRRFASTDQAYRNLMDR